MYISPKQRFLKYHADNPQVYEYFKKYTLIAIGRGFKELSAEFIINIIRWETALQTTGDEYKINSHEFIVNIIRWETAPQTTGDEYKINNNYKPFYSRKFMTEYPQYAGFFKTRASKADSLSDTPLLAPTIRV